MAATSILMATPISATHFPSFNKNSASKFSVKCMSFQPPNNGGETNSKTPPPGPQPPMATPPPAPKISTKFPDRVCVDGRLAMIGFVSAMAVELSCCQDVFTQIFNCGVAVFVGISVVLWLASLVQSKSDGIMTSGAGLWNWRVAMLGLVALAFTIVLKPRQPSWRSVFQGLCFTPRYVYGTPLSFVKRYLIFIFVFYVLSAIF